MGWNQFLPQFFIRKKIIIMGKDSLKSGQKAPKSGQYLEKGPRGGEKKEVTVPKNHVLPPTEKPNSTFKLVDPTKNKSGGGK